MAALDFNDGDGDLAAQHARLLRLQAFTEALALALTPFEIHRVCDAVGGVVVSGASVNAEGAFGERVRLAIDENRHIFDGVTCIVPLVVRRHPEGAVVFTLENDADDERALALAMARQVSLALERCALFRDEAAARQRTAILQSITSGLSRSLDVGETESAIVDVLAEAFGCAVFVCVAAAGDPEFTWAHGRGVGEGLRKRWSRFSRDLPGPVAQVVTTREPALYPDAAAWHAAWPDRSLHLDDDEFEAAALFKVLSDGGALRAIVVLRFLNGFDFDDAWRALLTAVAGQCGQAFTRALLRESERTARNNLGFLLEASRLLSSSLDVSTTLQALTALVVPRLADHCAIELGDDETTDPLLASAAGSRRSQPPTSVPPTSPFTEAGFVSGVLAASKPVVADGARSLVVPLVSDGHRLGVMRFSIDDEARCFSDADVELAGEIAARVSTAIANARRHQQLEEAKNELDRALRAKDEFLALFGHELRNPLMPITTALELMELRGVVGAERERAVIGRQARHLVRLVDDLLDVTRITRGRVVLHKAPVEITAVLGRALETASPALERGQHTLVFDVEPTGFRVVGDEDRLVQVFANLVQNAAKYTPNGGSVRVSSRVVGDQVIVDVADSGRGMPVDLVPQVFDLFVQGPRTIDRAEGGLGLGLAIVKNLVELHGGRVWARSPGPGLGSTFTVALPHVHDAAVAAPRSTALTPRRRRSILVVDDNEDLAGELGAAFEALGQDVFVCYDGDSALAELDELAAHGVAPVLALIDVGLPRMDGYELCGHLTARGIVAIAITGYGQETDRARALAAGFADLRVKPVSLSALAEILDRADKIGGDPRQAPNR